METEADRIVLTSPEPIECRDALEFLSRLDPSSSLWAPFEYGRWAFRGQADASWDLIPRAFRPGEHLSFRDCSLRALLPQRDQIKAEAQVLADFIELADELGFRLPGDLSVFRFPWVQHAGPIALNQSWPPSAILEVAAIAQHHGVPTRLLDFTFNPFVAAYFAASPEVPQAGRLAVWAVDVDFIQNAWATFELGVRVVQVSRGSNPFLHAQSGLFIYDAKSNQTSLRERILDQNVVSLTHVGQDMKDHLGRSPRVRCITLATRDQPNLLELLAARRVTRAHLQPTLDNVVGQLRSRVGAQRSNRASGA